VKRSLVLMNLALLAAVCLIGWYLHNQWEQARRKESRVALAALPPVTIPKPPPLGKVAPLAAPAYADVAVKNLFSKDRNPNPIPDPPPPPPPPEPMPPLPSAHGVMLWDGVPPTVVLSEHGNAAQKGYHPGDTIGAFKIVSIDPKEIVFDWKGQQIRKKVEELMDRTPLVMADSSQPQAAAPAQAPAASTNLANNASNGPGQDVGGGFHACVPGDNSPPGTVVDGLKKVVSPTPFGNACRWEAAK
jgi:hypothetical protein